MDKWENKEAFRTLSLVKDVLGGKQHKVCKFVSLSFEASTGELVDETAHTTARVQNTHSLPCLAIYRLDA